MSEIVFKDKGRPPDNDIVAVTLGSNYINFSDLKTHIFQHFAEIREEWKYYGQKYGWQLKMFYKKRNLLFIIPAKSYFRVVFIFGNRAVEEIEKAEISPELKQRLRSARKYAEGRGLSIEVKDNTYLEDIKKLIEIKRKN